MPNALPIPLIDFAPFTQGDRHEQAQVARQVYQACHEIGFMYLQNHGIPQKLLDELLSQTAAFFNLPASEKNKVARSPETNCGYVGLQQERLNSAYPGDLKEAFNVGEQACWLPDQPAFREAVSEFYRFCTTIVAPNVLRSFAIAFDLPPDFFDDKHGRNYILRLLHYPPVTITPQPGQLRAGAHTDYGSITLLLQDQVAGLEVQTRQGDWVAAPPIPGTVVVNVGDALQRWTNNRLSSTPHRVVVPSGGDWGRSRYSVALFCDPNPDVELACLEGCYSAEDPCRYAPILAGEYLASRLEATY